MTAKSRRSLLKQAASVLAGVAPVLAAGGARSRPEFLYVCDAGRGVVVKTAPDGEEVFTLGYPRESPYYRTDEEGRPLVKYGPTRAAVAPDGDIYILDGAGSGFVNQYNRKGEFLRTLAGRDARALEDLVL